MENKDLKTSIGHAVLTHLLNVGIDVAALIEDMTAPTHDATRGVALPTSAAAVRTRILDGRAILVTTETEFVAFASIVELVPGWHELSTVIVAPNFRRHHIARQVLYPLIVELHDQLGGNMFGTTKWKWLVPFGESFGLFPVPFARIPAAPRAKLCNEASCFRPGGKDGGCLNERVWPLGVNSEDPGKGVPCWVRMRTVGLLPG
ncbi:MAG: hypothetical protein NT003_02500 [Candidatus Magasanikbacteria bacterium]|nr:hypothetical protein [Candidatus Magasanikbacteria bacterium]